jgi:ABC-2 type transport system ATP-binding protein
MEGRDIAMIEVSNLSRYYGEFAALEDVSFRVDAGEIIGLLGLNGAGKTTTLKILAGLLPPSRGTVIIDGMNIETAPESFRSRIGYLPESPPLYLEMTVTGFLTYIGRLKGMTSAQVNARMTQVLKTTQLTERASHVISTLSHGFRKRVGIAQAIIHDPSLVILDEPISGLDPVQIVEMRDVIRSLGEGRAVLISSHILSEISQTCDRILVLKDGLLKAQGREEDLARRADMGRLLLTLRGNAEDLHSWLNAREDVTDVTPRPADEPFTSVTVTLTGDHREALISGLVEQGFGIRLVESPNDELEEIFLGLTRDGGPS